ncbi:MAG: hypothetical protein VYD64_02805, partial [Pseudomonadota bacterium]|nr:hypothetical protein [Pseudomonadota bacterium]
MTSLLLSAAIESAEAKHRNRGWILVPGVGIAIGGAILNQGRRSGEAERGSRQGAPSGRWQALAAANGTGTSVCNTSGDAYACFALRCGKGRGMEFAIFHNRGDYGANPVAQVSTERGHAGALQFSTVEAGREMVAAFDPVGHDGLIAALKAGNAMTLDIGSEHRFTLRGSSKEIERTFDQCQYEGFDPGTPVTVNQGTQDGDGTAGGQAAQPASLAWRADDTEESHVARIRSSAVSFGGACEEEQAVIERLQRDIQVTVDRDEMRAGEFVTVNWTGNTLSELIPVYLMLATDAPVRFRGDGFYALLPDAIAPFGIETFKDKTRAIVPLYGKGAPKQGRIEIEGILAGRVPLQTSVIGWQRKCQAEIAAVASLGDVKVKPAGAPVIDLD